MRKVLGALVLVVAIGLTLAARGPELTQSFVAVASSSYQRFSSNNEGALLTNDLGVSVTGLRITFSAPVPSAAGIGIGAAVSIVSNEAGIVVLGGSILAGGTVSVEWPVGTAEIVQAEWLQDGDVAGVVDLHRPIAGILGHTQLSVSFNGAPHLALEVRLDGGLSRSPDGTSIVRYLWEWSDGTIQEGAAAARTFSIDFFGLFFGQQTEDVTLTVWNAAGGSSSVTHTVLRFSIA